MPKITDFQINIFQQNLATLSAFNMRMNGVYLWISYELSFTLIKMGIDRFSVQEKQPALASSNFSYFYYYANQPYKNKHSLKLIMFIPFTQS